MKLLLCFVATLALVSAASIPDHELPRLTDTRIVGGTTAHIAKYPYQVSLRYKGITTPENAYSHRCGASIYSENICITAAHCIIATVASQFQVVAGTNNRRGNDGAIVPVNQIIMHEDYNPSTYDNDIAILVLGTSLPLNNYTIKAIELAEQNPREGAAAIVTGWGTTTEGGIAASDLQEVRVPIVSNEVCNDDYQGGITDSMLCAGVRGVGGKDACQGDSGGPLVVDGKLTGVVSWGYGCARPQFPGVYAKVPYLSAWLKENIAAVNKAAEFN